MMLLGMRRCRCGNGFQVCFSSNLGGANRVSSWPDAVFTEPAHDDPGISFSRRRHLRRQDFTDAFALAGDNFDWMPQPASRKAKLRIHI
jgi:hypothetical protein